MYVGVRLGSTSHHWRRYASLFYQVKSSPPLHWKATKGIEPVKINENEKVLFLISRLALCEVRPPYRHQAHPRPSLKRILLSSKSIPRSLGQPNPAAIRSLLWTEFPPVPLIFPYRNRRGLLSSLFLWRRMANTEKKIPHLHPNRKEGQINYVSQRKKQTDWWTLTGLPGAKSSPNLENSLPGYKSSQSVAVE